ncbi:hypothetical protein D9M72_383890 [compost metagenome]
MALESASVTSPSSITGTWPKGLRARNSGVRCSRWRRLSSTISKGRPSTERKKRTRCTWPEMALPKSWMGWAGWRAVVLFSVMKSPSGGYGLDSSLFHQMNE